MRIENEQERKTLRFIFNLACQATDRSCNDLTSDELKIFEGFQVHRDDGGELIDDDVKYDFDIIHWLKNRCSYADGD